MPATVRHWYREPYVWLLAAIPLCAVAAGAVILWFALSSEDGLVADDYYKRGLEINRTLARDEAAMKYALSSELRFITDTGQVYAELFGDQNFSYPPALKLGLHHATRSGSDQDITLERISDRGFSGAMPKLTPGRWYVSLAAGEWRLTGVLRWPVESATLSFRDDG